jgi:hypothetical protein
MRSSPPGCGGRSQGRNGGAYRRWMDPLVAPPSSLEQASRRNSFRRTQHARHALRPQPVRVRTSGVGVWAFVSASGGSVGGRSTSPLRACRPRQDRHRGARPPSRSRQWRLPGQGIGERRRRERQRPERRERQPTRSRRRPRLARSPSTRAERATGLGAPRASRRPTHALAPMRRGGGAEDEDQVRAARDRLQGVEGEDVL